ncbi:GroES-like protein [Tothia fuscella]|uniref:GroES-like protein n=1 Tax=Tothia fuscella TaxID=1048955 RepID=A0A9P4P1J4_9PEZI|nr:GroES-like protein [Tothia fuscella]
MAPSLPDEMLACQVVEYNQPYEIHKVPTPRDPGPYDLIVKVVVASLCHTDGMVSAGDFKTKLPCTGSHEGAGTVIMTGSSVFTSDFKEGDRVMCGLKVHPCGKCNDCRGLEKYRQYCRNDDGIIGVTRDGAFAEYVLVDSRISAKLPMSVSFETAAPLACAGCTAWRGVLQSKLKSGQWLAVVGGGGGLGHLGTQFAKALGIKVIAIDARDEGLKLSEEAGADVTLDARKGDEYLIEQVQKVTGGDGTDATINVSDAKTAAATACAVTKMHGVMIQIAQPEQVCIPFHHFIFRDIRVEGSLICSPDEAKRMLDVVAKHKISVRTNPFQGLEKVPELVELAHSGKMSGKGIVVVDPQQIEEEKKSGVEMV